MSSDTTRTETGRRVRALRESNGKPRAAVAGLLGKSEDWLARIERGDRGLPLESGVKLARLLGASDLSDIYGPDMGAPVIQAERPSHPAADAVGHAITGYAPPTGEPASVEWLQSAVARAWANWHDSPTQRTVAADALPGLIHAGRAVVRGHDGTQRRLARAALADVMHLGQAFLAWQGDARHWYWLTVDRGHQLAEDADQPTAYASGLLYSALALRVTGREDQALDLLRVGSEALEPHLDDTDDEPRGLWGVLQLARASTTARHQHDPSAWVHWAAAERMLTRLPSNYTHHHGFSAGHVALHRTWIAQTLGDATEALRHAEHVDIAAIPSRNWQASHLIHVAQALHQQRDSGALVPLLQAECRSPESVQYNLAAREIISRLTRHGQQSIRTEAGKLGERLGLAA